MKRYCLAIIAIAAALSLAAIDEARAANANCPGGGSPPVDGVCGVTVGTGSTLILNPAVNEGAANGYRKIAVDNESTTATCAVCFGASCTPALNTAGSFTIAPGVTRQWDVPYGAGGGYADAMNGICSASSTPLTVEGN
jgi:hypothetical protein